MVMFPELDETQRLHYLQALGVTSWLPTGPLVASQVNTMVWQPLEAPENEGSTGNEVLTQSAFESPASSLPREPTLATPVNQTMTYGAPQDTSQQQMQAAAVAQALDSLGGAVDHARLSHVPELGLQTDGTLPNSPAPYSMPAMVINTDRLAPMHLGLSWYSNGVLVVNDIPVQEGAAMSSPIQRLQTAIVNALRSLADDTSTQVMPAASMEFNWPLVPGPHADHSLMGAQSGLKYSLIKLLKDNPCSKLLIMGPAAMQLLKPDMALGESAYIELADGPIQSVYSHSLHQLLAVPSLKSDTWLHLQPLILHSKKVL